MNPIAATTRIRRTDVQCMAESRTRLSVGAPGEDVFQMSCGAQGGGGVESVPAGAGRLTGH
jgi:hypothetical protein